MEYMFNEWDVENVNTPSSTNHRSCSTQNTNN